MQIEAYSTSQPRLQISITQVSDWERNCQRHIDIMQGLSNRPGARFPSDFRCHASSSDVFTAVRSRRINNSFITRLLPLNQINIGRDMTEYCTSLIKLLNCEECYQTIKMRQFDLIDLKLAIEIDDYGKILSYGLSMQVPEDQYAIDCALLHNRDKNWYETIPTIISDGILTLKVVDQRRQRDWLQYRESLDVYFFSKGKVLGDCRTAVSTLRDNILTDSRFMRSILFEEKFSPSRTDNINVEQSDTVELRDRLDKLDNNQRQAVIRIMRARCRPKAYIVTGPPGSGKSHVIVEAVVQIFNRKPLFKLLVCATSSPSADRLYDLLREILPVGGVFRLRAGSQKNFRGERVVVATNTDSTNMSQKDCKYDYLFIDDANHANVPESLIAMGKLLHTGCLVLCGDPKQLGPETHWKETARLGLGKSLLDGLLEFKQYEVDGKLITTGFRQAITVESSDYISRLKHSYRCDERILATARQLFYCNEEVLSKIRTPSSILNIMHLKGPVQFMTVKVKRTGVDSCPETNTDEAICCVELITRLYKIGVEPKEIGVITPYKLQAKLISTKLNNAIRFSENMLNKRFQVKCKRENSSQESHTGATQELQDLGLHRNDTTEIKLNDWLCKIDTVPSFEGDERQIIIISTVAHSSVPDKLNNPKSFNVATSRAKWLLIVVGDPNALGKGDYWPKLLQNAYKDELDRWPLFVEEERPFSQNSSLFLPN